MMPDFTVAPCCSTKNSDKQFLIKLSIKLCTKALKLGLVPWNKTSLLNCQSRVGFRHGTTPQNSKATLKLKHSLIWF